MALYVTVVNQDGTSHEHCFHVGAGRFGAEIIAKSPFSAFEVQADGDELWRITNRFTSLPITNQRVIRWHGDFAKFIIANLEL